MSFEDIWRIFAESEFPGMAKQSQPTIHEADGELKGVIDRLKVDSEENLEELFMLYDPEQIGTIGMNDFFLFLKDLFISQPNILLYTTNSEESIFEAENSYKAMSRGFDNLLFDFVQLNRKMYIKSKNASFKKDMFWIILEALFSTKILNFKFKEVNHSQDQEGEERFESQAKKMLEKIEKLQEEEKRLESEGVNQEEPEKKPPIRSASPNRGKGNENNLQVPGVTITPPQTNNGKSLFLEVPRFNTRKSLGEASSSLNINQTLNSLSEYPQKLNSQEETESITDDRILKKTEKIWKKSLQEIFSFYNKLQNHGKGDQSFEGFKEKSGYMTLGEWVKFCSDFNLAPPKQERLEFVKGENQYENSRQILTNMFKKEAKGGLGINYFSFEVLLVDEDNSNPTLFESGNWERLVPVQNRTCILENGTLQSNGKLKFN